LYVCAAFLTRFSKDLLREKDFQVGQLGSDCLHVFKGLTLILVCLVYEYM